MFAAIAAQFFKLLLLSAGIFAAYYLLKELVIYIKKNTK